MSIGTDLKTMDNSLIKIGHSYNMGDLVAAMAGLQQLYKQTGKKVVIYQRVGLPSFYYEGQVNSTVDASGNSVSMNAELFSMLIPLIISQDYIHDFVEWKGEEVQLNFDLTRDARCVPLPAGTLHSWAEAIFPETATDLSVPWIKVEMESVKKHFYKNKILITRTQRYRNPYITYYFLKNYEKDILFAGTETEYSDFCSTWNLEIEKLQIDNFYQLAQVMNWCKFVISNQTFSFHLADAMKVKRVLELCASFPNTFVTGANGYQFYKQPALEYFVNKLEK